MSPTRAFFLRGWLFLAGCFVAGCGAKNDPGRTDADTRFDANKEVFAPVRNADQVTVYEGLPHQFFEAGQLDEEKRQKPTVTLHGYPFYQDRLEIPADDRAKLKAVLGAETSFGPWAGERKCGGFHPDYCVECSVGGAAYRFLICFGCSEAKVYGPDHNLRCDFRGETSKQLTELLKKHRKNRPPTKDG